MLDLHGISRAAFDLIVAEEVTGERRYNERYRHPEWPGESSGVTIGIGYDVGQASRAQFLADWRGRLRQEALDALARTCGVTGVAARPLAQQLRWVDVPWETALDVFSNHDVPRYLAMCRNALPRFDELGADCRGAILSVVFNRGPSFNKAGERYAEMRDIKAAIKAGQLQRIPGLLRSMKRLWPNTRGLRDRRDREAALFEKGLKDFHPRAHAALMVEAEPVDPLVVENVQRQLKQLGYYQVGNIDGSLTPGGKTEDAILAFRNRNGLPLNPGIDDDLLTTLARATPPEIAEERANATVDDLREQGSETIGFTDRVKGVGGKLFGGGSGLTLAGVMAWLTEKATAVSEARSAIGGLGLSPEAWTVIAAAMVVLALLAGGGLAIWYVAHRIEQKRLADYRIGKHS